MGQVNHPSNLLDQISRLRREIAEVRKKVGLSNATISRGGLRLLDDAHLEMVDDNGTQIVYIGPDDDGKQVLTIRREGGARILFTQGSEQFGRDFWALTDSTDRIVVSDDAAAGVGLARPWLPVPMYPRFVSKTGTGSVGEPYPYAYLDASAITGETVLWAGRVSISHPVIGIYGAWGQSTNTTTYRLKVAGTTVGEWTTSALETSRKGGFDVSAYVGTDWEAVDLTAEVTAGDGNVACQVYGCYLQQT